jgi:hypothetical protein
VLRLNTRWLLQRGRYVRGWLYVHCLDQLGGSVTVNHTLLNMWTVWQLATCHWTCELCDIWLHATERVTVWQLATHHWTCELRDSWSHNIERVNCVTLGHTPLNVWTVWQPHASERVNCVTFGYTPLNVWTAWELIIRHWTCELREGWSYATERVNCVTVTRLWTCELCDIWLHATKCVNCVRVDHTPLNVWTVWKLATRHWT